MNVWERYTDLEGIFYSHCQSIISEIPTPKLKEAHKFKDSGSIIIEGIKFIDDSISNFSESLHIGNIERYSYEYIQPTGFFFLYENEGVENGIRKPLHHLHVGIMKEHADDTLLESLPEPLIEHKGPHFIAPRISFNQFMGIIIVNFFNEDNRNCDRMLRSLGL